jgi:hypothetical protein
VATLAQAAQQRLGQCRIGEEVRPGCIWQVRSYQSRLAMMALFHELEEDVGLLGFYIDVPEFVKLRDAQRKSIHVAKSVMLTSTLPLPRGGQNKLAYAT